MILSFAGREVKQMLEEMNETLKAKLRDPTSINETDEQIYDSQ